MNLQQSIFQNSNPYLQRCRIKIKHDANLLRNKKRKTLCNYFVRFVLTIGRQP